MHILKKLNNLNRCRLQTLLFNRSLTERKKFYKDVFVKSTGDKFEIKLDKRTLKSPSGNRVQLPNETLAQAVALEWDSQKDEIKFHTMPMTNICFYAIENPQSYAADKSSLVDACMKYFMTDTILFHSDTPPGLAEYQEQEWGKIISWAQEKYNIKIFHTTGFTSPQSPQETTDVLRKHLLSYNHWALIGFERMISCLKSLVLSLALVERHVTVEEAVGLSRLELEFQISKWGNVEWHHDMELLDSRSKTAAAAIFIHSCSEDSRTFELRSV